MEGTLPKTFPHPVLNLKNASLTSYYLHWTKKCAIKNKNRSVGAFLSKVKSILFNEFMRDLRRTMYYVGMYNALCNFSIFYNFLALKATAFKFCRHKHIFVHNVCAKFQLPSCCGLEAQRTLWKFLKIRNSFVFQFLILQNRKIVIPPKMHRLTEFEGHGMLSFGENIQ